MIKQFNTAIGSASGSGGAKGSSKSGSAWIWGLLLVGAVYLGYKYIENRNKAVTKSIEQE
jgi:hypothetical protein